MYFLKGCYFNIYYCHAIVQFSFFFENVGNIPSVVLSVIHDVVPNCLFFSYSILTNIWTKILFTENFYFTEICVSKIRIAIRKWTVSSVIVVDDVSPVIRTRNVDRIRYCGSGVVCVLETQNSIFFCCCVWYI